MGEAGTITEPWQTHSVKKHLHRPKWADPFVVLSGGGITSRFLFFTVTATLRASPEVPCNFTRNWSGVVSWTELAGHAASFADLSCSEEHFGVGCRLGPSPQPTPVSGTMPEFGVWVSPAQQQPAKPFQVQKELGGTLQSRHKAKFFFCVPLSFSY